MVTPRNKDKDDECNPRGVTTRAQEQKPLGFKVGKVRK